MHDFADAFARRDEIKCSRIAIELVHIVNWSEDRTVFLAYMPQHNRDLSSQWVIHSIGLLMMAAIPIRTAGLERSTSRTNWTYSAYPSREAAAAGHRNAINLAMSGETESYPTLPSEFYNQVLDTGRMNSGFTQLDYLELALSVVIRVIRYAPAYFSWVGEIIQAYHVLLADRQRIQQQLPGAHHTRWASNWCFKVPTYDTRFGRFRGNTFKEMMWTQERELVYKS
ncbi:hypothetical protein F4823DRAFT_600846 [Ustulina deusta]|nr:hypothetical protein F4823DRAFT_600846 [Ustulina deusta]